MCVLETKRKKNVLDMKMASYRYHLLVAMSSKCAYHVRLKIVSMILCTGEKFDVMFILEPEKHCYYSLCGSPYEARI